MSSTSCCHSESPLFVSVVWAVWLHLRAPPAYYSFLLILLLILNFPLFPLLCCITLQQNRGGQRGFSTSPLTSVPIHRCARTLWTVSLYAREEWLSKIVSRVGRPEQNFKKFQKCEEHKLIPEGVGVHYPEWKAVQTVLHEDLVSDLWQALPINPRIQTS